MSQLKYLFGFMLIFPLLPLMYFQGTRIRKKIPKLPEAAGPEGIAQIEGAPSLLRLITLGESTIAGVGAKTHAEGFTGTLAQALAHRLNTTVYWQVYAQSGVTAQRVRTLLLPKITESSVDLVVVGLGANDAFRLHSPRKWRKEIQCLIKDIRQKLPDTPVVFCNMPPVREFPAFTPLIRATVGNLVELFGEELEKVAAKTNHVHYYFRKITLNDWINRLKINATKDEFFSDGVHPSVLTYQTWARDLANEIVNREIISII